MEMHCERRKILVVLLKVLKDLFDRARQIVASHRSGEDEVIVEVSGAPDRVCLWRCGLPNVDHLPWFSTLISHLGNGGPAQGGQF